MSNVAVLDVQSVPHDVVDRVLASIEIEHTSEFNELIRHDISRIASYFQIGSAAPSTAQRATALHKTMRQVDRLLGALRGLGDERWQALFDLARSASLAAMNECVPKPLVVESQVHMEGDCGGAFVVLNDGRRSFAR